MFLKTSNQALLLALLALVLVTCPTCTLGGPVRGFYSAARQLQAEEDETDKDADIQEAEAADVEVDVDVEEVSEVATDELQIAQEATGTTQSILDIATSRSDLTTLVTALEAAGLVEALGGRGPYTVFAPTDTAFVDAEIEFLLDPEWILHLESVLLYHVLEGVYATDDLVPGDEIKSIFENEPINVTEVNPLVVNDAEVVEANINATNGIVHIVDEVLFPEFTEVTIADLLIGIPEQFSTLVELLIAANLTDTLDDDDETLTIFAPNNDAFKSLDSATLELLASPEGADRLEDILLYHIVPGIAYATGVEVGDTAETLQESNITVTTIDPNLTINDAAMVVSPDILTRNGVIHILDTVLMPPLEEQMLTTQDTDTDPDEAPPEATGELDLESWVFLGENYTTLYTLMNATGLTEALAGPGPLTLFAPDDEAFDNVPDVQKYLQPEWYAHLYDILLYHVVPGVQDTANLTEGFELLTGVGENITVTAEDPWIINNMSTVVDPDNMVSNGVAHGIDEVLLPPSAVYDIVDVADASPFFEQLVGLIAAAGLEDTLSGEGPFTFFAPVNTAVSLLDDETTSVLRSPEGLPQLQQTLEYHVVPGIILSDDVSPGQMFETLQGCMLTLSQQGNNFYINDAQILDADILASNGVIHVINGVLLPADDCETLPPVPPPTEQLTDAPTAAPTDPPVDPVEAVQESEATENVTVTAPDSEEEPELEPVQPIETQAPEPTDVEDTNSTNATTPPSEESAPETPITGQEDATSAAPYHQVVLAITFATILPFLLVA